jgi:glycosyltransferase involved in cell wall biosynthesis
MNVLQILPELKSGGVERGAVDLAKYLQQKGHKAIVVSAGGPMVSELTACGAIHYALPVHKKSPFSVFRCVRALVKIVKNENIDIIHARSRVPALVAYFVSRKTQVPFVTTCHGFYSRHLLSYVMGWGKLVIVASHIMGRRMRDDFGVPHEKIRLIPRGVNLEEFKCKSFEPEPKNGTSTSGIFTVPSACWKFSTSDTRMRGVGIAVQLSECAYRKVPSASL